jgi:hypothetical protein
MSIFTHPLLTNDFQRELANAASTDSEVKARTNPAFVWAVDHHAKELLLKAVAQCTRFKPTPGIETKPSHWTAPPPGGPEKCVVVVMGLDQKGTLHACASNAVPKPGITDEPCTVTFFVDFAALRSLATQIKMLHQAASSVASKDHIDWVERIYKEGQRYRTSPIFLIVLDGGKQHFYATTALVEGTQQSDRAREWTGRVAA